MKWVVRIHDLIRYGQIGHRLYVLRGNPDGSYDAMFNPTMQHMDVGSFLPEDKFFISDESPYAPDVRSFLQAMSDAAWDIGIKPKQIEDNRNELEAVRDHLEDMRLLAKVK